MTCSRTYCTEMSQALPDVGESVRLGRRGTRASMRSLRPCSRTGPALETMYRSCSADRQALAAALAKIHGVSVERRPGGQGCATGQAKGYTTHYVRILNPHAPRS